MESRKEILFNILRDDYGIKADWELCVAIKDMSALDISQFVCSVPLKGAKMTKAEDFIGLR